MFAKFGTILSCKAESQTTWTEYLKSEIRVSEPFTVEETLRPKQDTEMTSQFNSRFLNIQDPTQQL